jgi:hypothetical protein
MDQSKQQTAVEWLYKELYEIPRTLWEDELLKIFEKAKEMEIKQMKESYTLGVKSGWEAHECKTK